MEDPFFGLKDYLGMTRLEFVPFCSSIRGARLFLESTDHFVSGSISLEAPATSLNQSAVFRLRLIGPQVIRLFFDEPKVLDGYLRFHAKYQNLCVSGIME
jgi:hypothetical protein